MDWYHVVAIVHDKNSLMLEWKSNKYTDIMKKQLEENKTHIVFIPTSSIRRRKPDHLKMMLKMCNQKFVLHNIEKFLSYCLECLQSITCYCTSLFTSTLREVYIVINFLVKLQNLLLFLSSILNLRKENRKP